ncbi:MAG TPA: serine hydrolase [Longimicrobium sp.]
MRLCLLALAAALAACARGEPASPWSEARLARLTLRQKAAQLVAARAGPAAPSDTALARLRRWVRLGGGLELAGGSATAWSARVAELGHGAPLPPLVAARAERGLVPRFADATELPAPAALALAGDRELAGQVAAAAAREARSLGAHLLLLPGPPLPAASGPYATPYLAPDAPGVLGAYLAALGKEGVLAGVTAFAPPGPADSLAPVVRWDRAALEVAQLEPLRAAARAGAAVEPAFVALPALTGDAAPLPFSGVAVQGVFRRDLGFSLVVADVGPEAAIGRRFGAVSAALAAVASGADLVVGAPDPEALVDSLVAAVQAGRISRERIDRAARRVFAAKARAGLGLPSADSVRPPLRSAGAAATAAAALERTRLAFGAEAGRALAGCRKTVLVTGPTGEAGVLSGELARRVPGLLHLQARAVARRGPLSRLPGWPANDADCVVAAVFPGAPLPVADRVVPPVPRPAPRRPAAPPQTRRPATGRRGTQARRPPPPPPPPRDTAAERRARRDSVAFVRDTTSRRIVHVAFAPEAADPPAGAASALVVWGTGKAAQRVAARWLVGGGEAAGADGAGEDGGEARPAPRAAWPPARTLVRAAPREAGMSADSLARVDRVMRRALDGGVFTAGAVAVGRGGRLVKLTGYGRTSGRPVDPASTLFDIASLTKVVGTTAAIMALVEDGEVRLDAPVRRYVPQFRGEGKGDVTIRHLLTHTSGLPAGDDLFGGTANPDEALRRVYRTSLDAEPGKRVLYSDFGMILLAEVVRRRAGEPLDRFLARRVFVPLGMERTLFDPPVLWIDRTVPTAQRSERPYVLDAVVHDGNAFRLGGVAGHAGLFSTAEDLAVYAQAWLNGGAYGARRVWSPATVRTFAAKQEGAGTRALGWDTPARASSAGGWVSARSYGHTGYTGTSLWIDPERGLFVVLLTNRTYATGTSGQIYDLRRAVANAAARAITDAQVRPRPGTPEAEAEAARQRAKSKPKRPPPRRPRGGRRRG